MIHVHIKNQSFTIVPMKTQIGIKHKAPPMDLLISLKLVTLTDVYFRTHTSFTIKICVSAYTDENAASTALYFGI